MKRFRRFSVLCLLCAAPLTRAQDATTAAAAIASHEEAAENYNTLKGTVDDLLAAQGEQAKQIQALRKEIEDLREQLGRPSSNYASTDALKQLADAVQELDKKRLEDNEKILKAIQAAATIPTSHVSSKPPPADAGPAGPASDQNGFYYVIKKDDSIGLIAKAYRDQGVKVTSKQIVDANPNINPAKLHVGTKIFIPAGKATSGN